MSYEIYFDLMNIYKSSCQINGLDEKYTVWHIEVPRPNNYIIIITICYFIKTLIS